MTWFNRKLQNIAVGWRSMNVKVTKNDVNMTSNRRCLVAVLFTILVSFNLIKSTASLIRVKFCMPVYISKTQIRSREIMGYNWSFIFIKTSGWFVWCLRNKKKKACTHHKTFRPSIILIYTLIFIIHVVFLCINTENNYYIIQNACA